MDTEHYYFYGLQASIVRDSLVIFLYLWLVSVEGGLTGVVGAGRHHIAHGTDQGICAWLNGEKSTPVGVHVVRRVQHHGHLHNLFWIDAEVAVGVLALDTVAGVAVLAFALVQLPPPFLLIEHALGIRVAGRGDMETVPYYAVAILLVATVNAVVAFLAVQACPFVRSALVTLVSAQRTLYRLVFFPIARVPLG